MRRRKTPGKTRHVKSGSTFEHVDFSKARKEFERGFKQALKRINEREWDHYQQLQANSLLAYQEGQRFVTENPEVKNFIGLVIKLGRQRKPIKEIFQTARLKPAELKLVQEYSSLALKTARLDIKAQEAFVKLLKESKEYRFLEMAEEELARRKQVLIGAERMDELIKGLAKKPRKKKK
jgi:hypothetical protein